MSEKKGKCAAVFSLKAKILGEKKEKQEAVVIEDPDTEELLFDAESIKAASLKYLKDLLTNRDPREGYENDLKVIKILHNKRMAEQNDENNEELTKDDFKNMLKMLEKKNKTKYKFILNGGKSYQSCMFKLFKITWKTEKKPTQWNNTIAHQLYKSKGVKSKLSTYRFIHTKDEDPKSFEHILMTKAKPKIVNGCSKFQIGALPKHQSQEHLFTLKSVMEWYEALEITLILELYDLSKFFDTENLQDGMNTLYNYGITGKLYRLIFEMNKKTVLKVKTGVGLFTATELNENIAQGSIGGALISTGNLDYTVNCQFKSSRYELSYSDIRLQPLIFQDDLSRLSSSVKDAQAGNILVEAVTEAKLLDLNLDKSCFIVIGRKNKMKNIRDELNSNPLTLCGKLMKEKVSDKYLGDYIHSAGVSASVDCTISNRYGRIIAGIIETRAIIDDCRVNTVGGLQAGLDYWEIAYLPSLLNNCQTWTNISEETMTKLENIQNMMFRVLLNVPQTCPKPALCWEMGSLQMKFRIISKKLNFLWHLKNLEDSSLANEIFCAQRDADMPGLVKECYELMDNLKLPNILQESISQIQWKSLVKKAIIKANEDDLRIKMISSSKLRTSDMIQEECITKPYVNQC